MPPIRQYQMQQPKNQDEENDTFTSPNSSQVIINKDKEKNRRNRRSPNINTRASRVGVTNFINVIKHLHPGESRTHFPINKESLQEYIDSKRKALIKAGSLEQYLQHIQAYNIALGFGWDGEIFGPIIKKVLDELRVNEEETQKSFEQRSGTFSMNPEFLPGSSSTPAADVINLLRSDYNINNPLFDMDQNDERRGIFHQNNSSITSHEFLQLAGHEKQSSVGDFHANITERKSNGLEAIPMNVIQTSSNLSIETSILKSVTIRSKNRVYKQKIAVGETTTFASIVTFAIKASPPTRKQFVIRSIDGTLEFMPEDIVKQVITDVEHAELLVTLEDESPVDFDYF
ncbi:hypothetical protein G9A89_003530 [Geosiphon pyriformis]|nr:hypothetical protein G9A89_003530 [Geosiphon pyriformis]